MSITVQLVANPESGSYSPALVEQLRTEFERRGTRIVTAESSARTALLIDPGADRICVIGGDGTLRHVVAAMQAGGRQIPLVPYPGGTVNLMQLETCLPRDIEAFVSKALGTEPPRLHYSVDINDTLFLACASVGPDSEAVAALNVRLKHWIGKLAYVVAFLGVLWRWPRPSMIVRIDDTPHPCEAFYVAKGRHFAGPWSFAPGASMQDPALHVVMIARLSRWRFLRFVSAMMLGRSVDRIAGIRTVRCTALSVAADRALPVQADGDIVTRLPARICIHAHPLAVVR